MFRCWRLILASLAITVIVNSQRIACSKEQCKTCTDFVKSFEKRFKDTENSNYAGGDTSWEEEKLGSYATSEVRLVEILDNVCEKRGHKCHHLLENNEEHLEHWWFKLRHNGKDELKTWLCFEHLDVCCPKNTFGANCEACPGGIENPCGVRGKCEGAEEKDGAGTCACDKGYEGTTCESCAKGFYSDSDQCLACDKSCKDTCVGAGPGSCDECANGYVREEEGECEDKDDCDEDDSLCKEGTYCFNTPGSYKCNACDRSCLKGCSGPGSFKCDECGSGYKRTEHGQCKDEDECKQDDSLCAEGTYCGNTPGSYSCPACHISCKWTCSGPGPGKCDECKDGYTRENVSCVDIDECEQPTPPCDAEREVCQNLVGTHVCRCKHGLVKREGVCVEAESKSKGGDQKKKKKKKSKLSNSKTGAETVPQKKGPEDSAANTENSTTVLHSPTPEPQLQSLDQTHEEL